MADSSIKTRKVASSEIRAALLLRYPPNSHALMHEVAPETGGGTRYADAVAVGLWRSHGHKIEGIEIKVSRSDFLSEMKQPEKSQPVFRYCDHWWCAAPKGMIKPEEIPPTWGLLELQDNGTMRVRTPAPKLDPDPVTIGFFASLCRRGSGPDREVLQHELNRLASEQRKNIEEQVRREYERQIKDRIREAENGLKMLMKIKDETGIDLTKYNSGEWVDAIKVVNAIGVGSVYMGIEDLHRQTKKVIQAIEPFLVTEKPKDADHTS